MKHFQTFLQEEAFKAPKNVHLTHVEDRIFFRNGVRSVLNLIQPIIYQLVGQTQSSNITTIKVDGAPAIVAGIDPESKKFFVGTKSVFNKGVPKINYTVQDIKRNHESPGLQAALTYALQHFPKLGIKGILQGDLLFTDKSVRREGIEGNIHLTFTPNTITYAVLADSALGQRIAKAKVGIAFHTAYQGPSIATSRASFNVNADTLKKTSDVFAMDTIIRDYSSAINFNASESGALLKMLNQISSEKAPEKVAALLESYPDLQALVMEYVNFEIKINRATTITVPGLIRFVQFKFKTAIDAAKTDAGKVGKQQKLNTLESLISRNRKDLELTFRIHHQIIGIKEKIMQKLDTIAGLKTFVQTSDGFRVTKQEGFVVSDVSNEAVKLVDRLEFARLNQLYSPHKK